MLSEIQRQPTVTASCTLWSLLFNGLFVLNLVTTPFMAYLNEPRPGQVRLERASQYVSFDDYVNQTTTFLQRVYTGERVEGTAVWFHQDLASNSCGMYRELNLPLEISNADAASYILQMPAAMFYGQGIRDLVAEFLAANATRRAQRQQWQMCQHSLILGRTVSEVCLWIEILGSTDYRVWVADLSYSSLGLLWTKCICRFLLAFYALYIFWGRYYRHYIALLSKLRQRGLSPAYSRYKVVVGDPAYVLLSDPVVSIAMVADIWSSAPFIAMATFQVCQFQDVWLYIRGCVYLSRCVWYGFLAMRFWSWFVKWRRWENFYVPVDPGLLAIATFVYCGPVMSLFGGTSIVLLMHDSWFLFLPSSQRHEATEGVSG